MSMNYMINDKASKQVAIEFAKWTILSGMWQSDLTFEEQYECWLNILDSQASEAASEDSIDDDKWFHQAELNDELAYDRWIMEQSYKNIEA